VLGFGAKIVPKFSWKINLALLVPFKYIVIVFGIEDELRSQKNVHNNTQAENVDFAAIAEIVEDFRSDVPWRAAPCEERLSIFDRG